MVELKPGRELDALIAEKVMEWRKFQRQWEQGVHRGTVDDWLDSNGVQITGPLPKFSTDIAAAWEVIEKIRDDNFVLEEHGTHWKVRFGTRWAGAETAPHAICLAALNAVGFEIP